LDESLSTEQRQEFTELWRAAGSPAAPEPPTWAPPEAWLAPAEKIIKEFEGCRLKAYPDPASGGAPWTIGYGTTRYSGGGPVRKGDTITQSQAEEYLRTSLLDLYAPSVFHLIPSAKNWNASQVAATLSLGYNIGLGALEDSTLRRRMNAGESPVTVFSEEAPRWNKADGKVLEGLVRRRNAEVELFVGQSLQQDAPKQHAKLTPKSPFSARLTPNIRLGEFALDQEARRFQYQYQIETALELAQFLERVRRNFDSKPVVLTSGYRPPAINASVGGASGSEHLYDAPGVGAVDFYVNGADIKAVQLFCDKYWPFSVGYGAPKGFVHLGLRAGRPRLRWDYA
jgi:GH24 family phage-related lysozyme (muramidase)